MRFSIYGEDLRKTAYIGEQYISCLWDEQYTAAGSMTLELPNTEYIRRTVSPGSFVGRADRRALMIIKSVEYDEQRITATGYGAERALEDSAFLGTIPAGRRIVDNLLQAYSESTQVKPLVIGKPDIPDVFQHQISNKSMWDLAQAMCGESDIGIRTVSDGNAAIVDLYKPAENRNAKFSSFIGNLQSSELLISQQDEKNFAFVLGQGEGADRVRVEVDLSGGAARREMIVEASDIMPEEGESPGDYKARLYERGREKLQEYPHTERITIAVNPADFGTRYDLGDIVSVALPEYGMSIKARIVRAKTKDSGGKLTTTISVGSPVIFKR